MANDERLRGQWRSAGEDLGFGVVEDFELRLSSGKRILVPVLVPCFGAINGMLVVTAFDQLEGATDELVEAGYGYSVMDEPREGEEYDRESFIDILVDWGWSGEASASPKWLSRP